ncbi:MAG: helix-turn-helix domain-containing protein [Bacillus sp. (in: firmicutes)]
MLHIHIQVSDSAESQKIAEWLTEIIPSHSFIIGRLKADTTVCFWEVDKLFDWVIIRRIQKRHSKMLIIPVISHPLAYSSVLAMDMKLPSLLIKPIQRSPFIRIGRKIRDCHLKKKQSWLTYRMLYEQLSGRDPAIPCHAFYRRLVRGEICSEQELYEASSFLQEEEIPNTVIFIQGFCFQRPTGEEAEMDPGYIIKKVFQEKLLVITGTIHFLSFTNHLLITIHVPQRYRCMKKWKEGHSLLHECVQLLSRDYGIKTYIGVGDVHHEPLFLHISYREARKARRLPTCGHLQVRYYVDLPKNRYIEKIIDYIEQHSHEQMNAKAAAEQFNFSSAYFSRLFNKETGKSFVEYVMFIRIRKSLVYLRRTEYTIEEISDLAGFNTPNYYSSTFRKYVGLTPSEYRATKEITF